MRLAYLHASRVVHEESAFARGEVPSHRLFFAAELRQFDHEVTLCPWKVPPRFPSPRQWWKILQAVWCGLGQRRFDAVVCTHEAAAFGPLALKAAGLLRVPVVVLTVAATGDPYRSRGPTGVVRRFLLRRAAVLCTYTSAQVEELSAVLGVERSRVNFLPLGVDTSFFRPRPRSERGAYVLAVGTNAGKDYPTLVRALPAGEHLVVVTDEENIRRARAAVGDQSIEFRSHVPITELREMYHECRVLVLPLRDIGMSTGQTVLLENLAIGTPVIVSGVPAVADYVGNDGNPVVVPPGDVQRLADAIADTAGSRPAGCQPRVYSARASAERLATLLREVTGAE